MGVGVHRYTNLGMAHQVLQGFGIHTAFGLVGAVCMAAHMGSNQGKLFLVNAVVLLPGVLEVMLPMHCYRGTVILIQEQESRIAVNGRLDQGRLSVCQDSLKTGVHIILHRQHSCTCVGLGGFNVLCAVRLSLQLMVNADGLVLHIQVADGQSRKFGDSQTRMEQDINAVIVFAVVLVLLNEGQELPHLLPGDGFPCYRIVDNDLCKLKIKGILSEEIILHRCGKSGA